MGYTVPTNEPSIIYAGDTLAFKKIIPDFPASEGWTLTYYLLKTSTSISFAATASGNDYSVSIPASTTSAYAVGEYDWFAEVSKGSSSSVERYNVAQGHLAIKKSAASSSTGADNRTVAKKMVDAFESYFASSADIDDYAWIRKAVGDLDVSKISMKDLYNEYQSWKQIHEEELKISDLSNGRKNLNCLHTRFTPL